MGVDDIVRNTEKVSGNENIKRNDERRTGAAAAMIAFGGVALAIFLCIRDRTQSIPGRVNDALRPFASMLPKEQEGSIGRYQREMYDNLPQGDNIEQLLAQCRPNEDGILYHMGNRHTEPLAIGADERTRERNKADMRVLYEEAGRTGKDVLALFYYNTESHRPYVQRFIEFLKRANIADRYVLVEASGTSFFGGNWLDGLERRGGNMRGIRSDLEREPQVVTFTYKRVKPAMGIPLISASPDLEPKGKQTVTDFIANYR